MSKKRIKGSHSVYHVIWRAINKQMIFCDEKDFNLFLSAVKYSQKKLDYDLIAYCIMGNHVHLMIKEGTDDVSKVMQIIGATFVRHYNDQKNRLGPLFHSRFKSEPIETRQYFIRCIRYICMNPVKAGIVKCADEYKYSSFNEMCHPKDGGLISAENIEKIIPISTLISLCDSHYDEEEVFMDVDNEEEIKAYEITKLINQIGYSSLEEIRTTDQDTKEKLVHELAALKVSKTKISEILKLSKYKIEIILHT